MAILNIVYLADLFGFPEGPGASNYIRLLARGLINAGCRVRVLIPNTTEDPGRILNQRSSGEIDGIKFEYTTGTPIKPESWTARKWARARGRWWTQFRLFELKRSNQLDCLVLYGRNYRRLKEIGRLCNFIRVPLLIHLTEWKDSLNLTLEKEIKDSHLFHAKVFSLVDGAIVISHYLEESASKKSTSSLPIIRIPLVMEKPASNDPIKGQNRDAPYILYCADIDGYFEDAVFVLKAFADLNRADLKLIMVGRTSQKSRELLEKSANENGCGKKLEIISNYISNEQLQMLYTGASALLAPLPENEISRARFPSKIAGYLAAGVPVVSCRVGEVSLYLEDGVSAYLSRPGDPADFSQKIVEALDSPGREQVAQRGRQIALQNFDLNFQGSRLAAFVRQITGK